MDRKQLEEYIRVQYGIEPEHPWARYPEYAVFRHREGSKWFAVAMTIPKTRLMPEAAGFADILNLKCDPMLIPILRDIPGFYPAWHMNKAHWITVLLDGSVDEKQIGTLLSASFDLTKKKKTKGGAVYAAGDRTQ